MERHHQIIASNRPNYIKKLLVYLTIILTIQLSGSSPGAQTCSCGGPPLLGSLESLPGGAGDLQLSLTYDYRSISDLVSFRTELDDNTRARDSRALLIQADYSFNSRITLSLSFPFVRQSRTVQSLDGRGENLLTRGFGDVIALGKYSIIRPSILSRQSVAVGFGVKLPTGKSDLRDNGLLISADLQTGSGSTDYLLWGSTSRVISRSRSINLFASVLYRLNGTNQRFGIGEEAYQFGDEFRLVTGLSFLLTSELKPTIGLRYRYSQADKFAGSPLSSSGGKWLDLEPGLNTSVKKLGLSMMAQIPVYRSIKGTQFSTSYSISFSLFYLLNLKGSDNELL